MKVAVKLIGILIVYGKKIVTQYTHTIANILLLHL